MGIVTERFDAYALISVNEDKLNTLIAPELKAEFTVLGTEGINNIILDLKQVSFADSSGLSAILTGNRFCKGLQGNLIIAGAHENVQKLVSIAKLDSILTLVPTTSEASALMMMNAIEGDVADESE